MREMCCMQKAKSIFLLNSCTGLESFFSFVLMTCKYTLEESKSICLWTRWPKKIFSTKSVASVFGLEVEGTVFRCGWMSSLTKRTELCRALTSDQRESSCFGFLFFLAHAVGMRTSTDAQRICFLSLYFKIRL